MLSNNPPIPDRLAVEYTEMMAEVEALAARANAGPKAIRSEADKAMVAELVTDARALLSRFDKARVAEKEPYLSGGRAVDGFFKAPADRLDRIRAAFQHVADSHAREVAAEARRKAEEEARKAREEEQRQREIAERADAANRAKVAAKATDRADAAADAAAASAATANASDAALAGKSTTTGGNTITGQARWDFEVTNYAAIPLDALRPYLKRDAVESAIRAFVKFNTDTQPLPGVRIFADVRAAIR